MRICYGCNKETTETTSFRNGPHLCFTCRTDPYKQKVVNRINDEFETLKAASSSVSGYATRYFSMTPSEQVTPLGLEMKTQLEFYRKEVDKTLENLARLNSDH